MEKFVDKIIETDRKAREIIEAAQQEKDVLAKQAALRAQQELEHRAAVQKQQIAVLDAQLEARVEKAAEQADRDYIAAKHTLDNCFAGGRDTWLTEILQACKQPAHS